MEPVGELDQEDADVLAHRQDQLPEVLCLLFLVGLQLDAVELGHAVDQSGDLLAKLGLDVLDGGVRVLHRVVE